MSKKNDLADKIRSQVGAVPNGPAYWVGEQIKEICVDDEHLCGVVLADLDNKEMTVKAVETKIRDWAKAHGGCCPPQEADRIIRETYKLPSAGAQRQPAPVVDLLDFLG